MKNKAAFTLAEVISPRPTDCRKAAFTLAEVLITLGIIGVVAAMTMPSLIASHKEKETVVKLKKVYSTISNAYLLAKEKYGTPDNWDLVGYDSGIGAENELNKFAEFLNVSKNCGTEPGCWPKVKYKYLDGSANPTDYDNSNTLAKLVMADGTTLLMNVRSEDCTQSRGTSKILQNVCGTLAVDINGAKPPNQVGKDYFSFSISKEGIVPHGTQDETMFTFEDNCLGKPANSWSCTAWVIINENMDYLHCNDLSWTGKPSCK